MNSLILSSTTRFILPMLLLFSVFAFLRGHNEPGGGFIGGLVAAAGIGLCVLAEGVDPVRKLLRVAPRTLMSTGMLTAIVSALLPLIVGKPFFTGLWGSFWTPLGTAKLGTPLLFDLGVYLIVVGMVLTVIFELAEDPEA